MSYFSDNYSQLSYPIAERGAGLYNAQLGAIHRIASHFTTSHEPALVTMPTGSGKTAVLMMTPFVIRAHRVLVITPSRMVREQITEDFSALGSLRKARAIPDALRSPRVNQLTTRVTTQEQWNSLRDADVVISTPNCASPAYEQIPEPPVDLFDLVLIDEAHHTPAATWAELLDAFPRARRVLFTATPFRRDRSEIKADFIYTYAVEQAFADGIFGRIRYVPVTLRADDLSADVAVARQAEVTFRADRAAGLNHYLMVRTDTRPRANVLMDVYAEHTALRLALIHSGISSRRVRDILRRLELAELDGIVCVNMLGEGFNFPRLKIAAVHAPHKSLEVTLQFIGRFARTNAPDIGEAKFVALKNEIELEGERLFDESAVWQEIIQDLSYTRIAEEVEVRRELDRFADPEAADVDLADLSLYSLHPRSHVKIYDVAGHPVSMVNPVSFPGKTDVRYRNINTDGTVAVIVAQQRGRPKWSATDKILDNEHVLVIVVYDRATNLLFVNASVAIDGFYEAIVKAVCPLATTLSMREVMRVIRRLRHQRIFNYGVRNIQATNVAESYRITAGSDTQLTIRPSDARLYRQGHVYMTGEIDGEQVTIGYSAGSKVWASAHHRIPALVEWCRALGREIRDETRVITNTGLDHVATGEVVTELPENIVLAQWDRDAFGMDSPARVEYRDANGQMHRLLLMELDIEIDRQESNRESLRLHILGPELLYRLDFSLISGGG